MLLIEAGPDEPPGREHREIRDPFPTSVYNPRFSWRGLTAETGVASLSGAQRTSRPFLQGRGVGGSANINGMNVWRGQPGDYDEWADSGADGWGWENVLPYFRKLETDLDFSGPFNGTNGPMPMRRVPPEAWAPFSRTVAQAMARQGFRQIDDYNADFADGFASLPISSLPDRRITPATAYLTEAVRRRGNLKILADTVVQRIHMEGKRVTGVELCPADGPKILRASTVIVACGGVLSPALLLRSGVGPGAHLQSAGVPVVADLPGVGRNLQNHPSINVTSYLPLRSMQPLLQRAIAQNCLRYSSNMAGCAAHDMGLVVFNRTAWHPLGRRIGSVVLSVHKAYSIGSVSLASPDPAALPDIRFNTLHDPRDFDRMVSGLKLILDLLTDPDVKHVRNEAFLPDPRIVAKFGRRTAWNVFRTAFIASVLDIGPLRRALLGDALLDLEALRNDDQALADYVRHRTSLSHHVCGTCRMGRPDDPLAVTDQNGRVRGIVGLHVGDPSIFPSIPRGGMHIQAIMAAEKLADAIKADIQTQRRDGTSG
ncbi:hypothetical protein ASE00_13565 [Sphingomonas sp. Root710]|nr:hypothetical protein ASE00_13565 [Sphingomonas sp. Root710]